MQPQVPLTDGEEVHHPILITHLAAYLLHNLFLAIATQFPEKSAVLDALQPVIQAYIRNLAPEPIVGYVVNEQTTHL